MIRVAVVLVVAVFMGPPTFQPFSYAPGAAVRAGPKMAVAVLTAEVTAPE